ncbi:MAG TPA: PEPxxWA-CTERM sorting domain-containing protein [Caulobacteraceae bacterium]|jgi:hypothetical protein|nr:PEPxxWA-CTERM sorting domain-containing protein [Caulobacteraceae bacterium]
MKSLGILLAGALGLMASGAAAGSPTFLFNDFGPGQSYYNYGTLVEPTYPTIDSFVSWNSGNLTQIDIAIQTFDTVGGAKSVTVSLWTDMGDLPGSELGSWDLSNLPIDSAQTSGDITTIAGISGISLTAGNQYWLKVASSVGDAAWSINSQEVFGQTIFSDGNAYPTIIGAFDALSSGVPEPGTWMMLIFGIGMTGYAARKRRQANAISA